MIIISSKPGQLGNRLFVFAGFIAFAKEFNYSIKNPSFTEYSGFFEKTIESGPCFPVVKRKKIFSLLDHYFFAFFFARILHRLKIRNKFFSVIYLDWDEDFNLLLKNDDIRFRSKYVFIQGWQFTCNELLNKYRPEIKEFFQLDFQLNEKVNVIHNVVSKGDALLIGIHIRQGDYKSFEGGKYYYTTDLYYKKMINMITLFPKKKLRFIICSNEKQNTDFFPELDIHICNEHYIVELYLLARCNYIIGPPSTFSMWASFYGSVPLYMIKDPNKEFSLSDFQCI